MKKLSEIGETVKRMEEHEFMIKLQRRCLLPKDEHDHVLLSFAERRELVEKAIVSFIAQEMESRTNLYILQTRLPAFLKEQNL